MSDLVSCEIDGPVATLQLDDGKVNVLSPAMQSAILAGLDVAENADAVVITGREKVFSAGFDLTTIQGGGAQAVEMLRGGFKLAERVLTFPKPVVMACNGHAIAMGLFLMICGDYRIGADFPARLTANEVAIGMSLPQAAIDICHIRMHPAWIHRCLSLAEVLGPSDAVSAGWLDRTVPAERVLSEATMLAGHLATLNLDAHRVTKLRVRAEGLTALQASIERDFPPGAGL